jgi:hypothetical protein
MYSLAVLWQTIRTGRTRGWKLGLLAMPLLLACHVYYGLGFWRGLATKLNASGAGPPTEVKLESMPV